MYIYASNSLRISSLVYQGLLVYTRAHVQVYWVISRGTRCIWTDGCARIVCVLWVHARSYFCWHTCLGIITRVHISGTCCVVELGCQNVSVLHMWFWVSDVFLEKVINIVRRRMRAPVCSLCVCVCVCVCVCDYLCVCVCRGSLGWVFVFCLRFCCFVSVCALACAYIYICTYTYVRVCMYMCVSISCMFVCACV